MSHPELAAEQAYVDRAYEQLDRMRSTVARTQEAMATEWAALNIEAWVKRRMRTFEDAERGLVFGRLTLDGTPRPLYVGRRWVHDAEPEGALVVQGGPGTGKTAVGLHRASWLLYTHRERLRRVLVVGPNPTFMDYVSHVLPTLGEEAVEQRAVTELLDGIEAEREEEPDVARLKGDPRLREVVARAVEIAVVPAPEELVTLVDGVYVRVRERDVAALLEEALEVGDPLGLARDRFRMAVLRRFYERYGELFGPRALRSFDELEGALRRGGFLTRWLDRVLPRPPPDKLFPRLPTSPPASQAACA